MVTKTRTKKEEKNSNKSSDTCYCPKCKLFIEETQLEGLSLICPFCGSII